MKTTEQRAFEFANFHHAAACQVRKYTGEPYIVHPAAVAHLVRGVQHTDEMLAAAWLHDTVEDTDADPKDILEHFGETVFRYVHLLTDVGITFGNRERRKRLDRERLAMAPPEVQTVKLADLIDNSHAILQHEKTKFLGVYMLEKAKLLDVLQDGDPSLRSVAEGLVNQWLGLK